MTTDYTPANAMPYSQPGRTQKVTTIGVKAELRLPKSTGSFPAYLLSLVFDQQELPDFGFDRDQLEALRELGTKGTQIIVASNRAEAERLVTDLKFFSRNQKSESVVSFLPWEVLPFDALSPTPTASAERLLVLYRLYLKKSSIVVTTPEALLQQVLAPNVLESHVWTIALGDSIERVDILQRLAGSGYKRTSLVEEHGDFAVRGSVIDFYPPGYDFPVRIEFFGNEVDSVRTFDVGSQRSVERLSSVLVLPVGEVLQADIDEIAIQRFRERASELVLPLRDIEEMRSKLSERLPISGLDHLLPLVYCETATVFDYLPENFGLVVLDCDAVEKAARDFQALVHERADRAYSEGRLFPQLETAYNSADWLLGRLSKASLAFEEFHFLDAPGTIDHEQLVSLKGEVRDHLDLQVELGHSRDTSNPLAPLVTRLGRWLHEGYRVLLAVSSEQRQNRVVELLSPYGFSVACVEEDFVSWNATTLNCSISTSIAYLSSGFVLPKAELVLISEKDIFPEIIVPLRRRRRVGSKNFIKLLTQLGEGDFVVHIDHGVAIYRGLTEITVENKIGDYLTLEYADNARLFLPVEQLRKIQRYVGVEGQKPVLSKLGSNAWSKTKQKVRENVAALAGQLVSLYATRELATGYCFGQVDVLDRAFADSFPFEETPDQRAAIDDVLADMAKDKPMDRLVCGDVGYGKTEVALRAAVKAAGQSKQVAVLVPTTILAEQHYTTFNSRLDSFSVAVGCVSRFYSAAQNRETLRKLTDGEIDIIIGTHRLLQRDVMFKDLGLVIVDEEHRFGVAHKEKLKRFRESVDVLTLTATPIPRTLHMSLIGIRDLSIIETAPVDRQVITTYLAPFDQNIVREAILREINRGGQVFYVHNRVQTIHLAADEVRELVPEAIVAVAHGQMSERELSQVMRRFLLGEVNVLVCTTIIESGLDIANANTIIIRKAENFGLAELYQLRGRVGRSSRRAYAYLLISNPKELGVEAKKRLQVLQSLDDLGQGFRLALQDMEIRGAGNLLGKDQSGQVSAVGFDLYSRILKEAIQEVKRKRRKGLPDDAPTMPEFDPEVQIGFPAYIPPHYIPDEAERLLLYQRLVEIGSAQEALDLLEEIKDRFGQPPEEVPILVDLMIYRTMLRQAGIVQAVCREHELRLTFHPRAPLKIERLWEAAKQSAMGLKVTASLSIVVPIERVGSPAQVHEITQKALDEINRSSVVL